MSVVPVSVFAVDVDNNSTGNSLNSLDGHKSIAIENGYNPEDIKFKGTLTFQRSICGYNGYYFKVDTVLEGSIFTGDEIHVMVYTSSMPEPLHNYDYPLEIGDKAEIYAIKYYDAKSYDSWVDNEVWGATITSSADYYVKKLESEPSLAISVWTDKSEYNIGETVTIYYQTNKKCNTKLTITKPDGGKVVYGPNEIPKCTRSKSPTAGYPIGKRTVVFEAWAGSESKKATCYFDVVEEAKEVKFRGKILADYQWISFHSFDVKIDKVLDDPTGNLQEGETVNVYGHRSGPAQVDDVTVGDEVEVFGEYRGYVGTYEQIFLSDWGESSSDHYVKKIEEKPAPEIIKVTYPTTCVEEGEYVTISVTVKNNGGASSEGYISVSFPNDEYIPTSSVSGTGNGYNKLYPKESEIWGKYGRIRSSKDPLVELQDFNWYGGEKHTLTMSVKPNSGSDEIVFYVRAALKNDADGDYERDPTYTRYTDQQGWYAKKYSVDVCDKPDLIDVDIINRFDDKTPQYIHDVFTWVKCVVDKMLRDAVLSFANAPEEPGFYIDNTINLKFENYQEIHKVSVIFGTDYVYLDEIIFNNAGNGVYTRNVQIESPVKWRYDTVNTIFKSLSDTGKLPAVPEIGPATLPEVRLQSVLVELNDGSTVSFDINERMKMFSKSNTFPTLVNRDQDNIVANCPIHLLVIDKQGRKVGIEKSSTSYLEFHEIPNAIYSGDTEPEYIILCDIPEYSVVIQAVEEGKFIFKIDRSATKTTMTYLDVPVTETTIATVDVSKANPAYTMEIDKYGDGTTIETKEPDSIETIGCTYDHDGDGIVEDDLDDLMLATDAYLGFNTGIEYDADGDGIVEDDLDDLMLATDAYLGFITCEGAD